MYNLKLGSVRVTKKELEKSSPDFGILELAISANKYMTDYEKEVIAKAYNYYADKSSTDFNLSFNDYLEYASKMRKEVYNLIKVCHNSSINRMISEYRGYSMFEETEEFYNEYRV